MYSDMHELAPTRSWRATTDTRLPREVYDSVRGPMDRARLADLPPRFPVKSVRNRALVIMAIFAVAALWSGGGGSYPLEATIQLEQWAARVERRNSIHPNTARRLARILAQPEYDCARTACSAALQARNSAARARLETLIAMKTRHDALATASGQAIAAGAAPVVVEPR
jgi:hypothetical protein